MSLGKSNQHYLHLMSLSGLDVVYADESSDVSVTIVIFYLVLPIVWPSTGTRIG